MSELPAGTVVGGVRVDAVAGRGGMGVVYRGTQVALKRTVALKVVRGDLADDPEFRDRFVQECEIAASLDHPHIVPVYAAGEDRGLLYATMRFVEGTDLRRAIHERGRLAPAQAAGVAAQIGAALDAAHRRGLVHRDIKPANILLAEVDGAPHAYLTDFGLSRLIGSDGPTRTGTVVGTPDYLTPEQLEGRAVDARTDVYALGCVLHQALTGQVPFPRDTQQATIWAHLSEPPPRPSTLVPDLPPGFDDVIGRALAKKPDDRYGSAGELGRAALDVVRRTAAPIVDVPRQAVGPRVDVARQPAALTPMWAAAGPARPYRDGGPGVPGPPSYPSSPSVPSQSVPSQSVPSPSFPSLSFTPVPPRPVIPRPVPPRNHGPVVALVMGVVLTLAAIAGTLISLQRDRDAPAEPAAGPAQALPAGTVSGAPVRVGKEPIDVEVGEGFVWAADSGDGALSRIDPATGTTEQIQVGGAPSEIAVTPGAVWVWNYSDAVTRVDIATGRVGDPVTPNGTGDITGIAAGGGFLWLSHSSSNSVSRIDLATNAPTGRPTTVGNRPIGVAFGTRSLFVVNDGDRTLSVLDGTTGAVSGDPIALGDEVGGVGVQDGTIYVGTTDDVTPIDEASSVVGDPIPLKGGSLFVADTNGIWVAFPLANELRWFDLRGQESRGGPVSGIGKGVGDLDLHDGTLWLSHTADGTVTQVRTGGA